MCELGEYDPARDFSQPEIQDDSLQSVSDADSSRVLLSRSYSLLFETSLTPENAIIHSTESLGHKQKQTKSSPSKRLNAGLKLATVKTAAKKPPRRRRRPVTGAKLMKDDWQRRILLDIFEGLQGPITRAIREKATSLTGLPWRKIYKWTYDMDSVLNRKRLEFTRREGESLFDYSRTK